MKKIKVSLLLLCSILAIQLEASFDNARYRFAQPIQAQSPKAITEINIPKYKEYQELDAERRDIIGISFPRKFVLVESRVPAEMQPQDTDQKQQQEKVQPLFIEGLLPIFKGLLVIKELERDKGILLRTIIV